MTSTRCATSVSTSRASGGPAATRCASCAAPDTRTGSARPGSPAYAPRVRTLTRQELTAALAARQMLLERAAARSGRGDPAADAAAGAALARAVRRARRAPRGLRRARRSRRRSAPAGRQDDDHAPDAARRRRRRVPRVRAAHPPGADAHAGARPTPTSTRRRSPPSSTRGSREPRTNRRDPRAGAGATTA